jgi:hypothetical protein
MGSLGEPMGVTGLAASRRRRERGVELKTRLDFCIALTFLYIRSEPPGWIRARVQFAQPIRNRSTGKRGAGSEWIGSRPTGFSTIVRSRYSGSSIFFPLRGPSQ